jgi:hypothetical protein
MIDIYYHVSYEANVLPLGEHIGGAMPSAIIAVLKPVYTTFVPPP